MIFFLLCLLLGLWCVHGARARTGDLFSKDFFFPFGRIFGYEMMELAHTHT